MSTIEKTVQSGKWAILSEKLMEEVKANSKKPKDERLTISDLLSKFAQEHDTTPASAQNYFYTKIRPMLDTSNSLEPPKVRNIDEAIMQPPTQRRYSVNEVIEVDVISVKDFGALVRALDGTSGLIHISEIDSGYVMMPQDYFDEGEHIRAKIVEIKPDGRLGLSTRAIGGRKPKRKPVTTATVRTENPFKKLEPIQSVQTEAVRSKVTTSPNEKDQIITFIKKYSDNTISQRAAQEIDEMVGEYGVFATTMALVEAVRDLDISSFITSVTKEKLKEDRL